MEINHTSIPQKLAWSDALISRFKLAGFTPAIIGELTTLGQVHCVDQLTIVTRAEKNEQGGVEVVWMASLGKGLVKWVPTFLDGARRAGASAIRFHIDSHERGVLRLVRRFHPISLGDGVYRVPLTKKPTDKPLITQTGESQ